MKASEIIEKDTAELQQQIVELRKEQFNLRMQRGMGQSINTQEFSRIRKDIARVKTVINQKVRSSEQDKAG